MIELWIKLILCRIDIRKGLNALKREIPGGDTFMHLGLERVDEHVLISA